MSYIKFTKNNEEKLKVIIAGVEGKARERLLCLTDINTALEKVEKHLNIKKKALEGTEIYVDVNAQSFPNAYKYIPYSTNFKAKYRKGTWLISDITRSECTERYVLIILPETAKVALLERMSKMSRY